MRIPTLGALTLAAAAAVVAVPTTANAASPVAVDDTATTTTGVVKSFNVLTNDTDADADQLSMSVTTEPAHGAVSCSADGACTYTPTSGWSGTDTFTYTVSDGTVDSTDVGQVSVETVDVRSITIASTPSTTLTWPTAITEATPAPSAKFTGFVRKDTPTGSAPAEGVQVQLMAKPSGATEYTAVPGAVDTSDDTGKVVVSGITPSTFTTYKFKAGSFLGQLSSLSVTPSLTTKFLPKTLALSDTVLVSGTSGPATGGEAVELQRRNAAGNWVSAAEPGVLGSPDENGYASYSFELPEDLSGKYIYRVVVPKTTARNAATSGQTTVKRYDARVIAVDPRDADEFVTLKNNGNVGLNLEGWVLTNGTREVTLPKWALGTGDTVRIHSGRGTNTARNLYLKGVDRWSTSGTITLIDKRTTVIDELAYPVVP